MSKVIEFLTFQIEPSELEAWLDVEEATWTRFLEQQPGFVSKQVWVERGETAEVHAVICWRDEGSWKSIPDDELAAVDAAMGIHVSDATCRMFDVLRDH